MNLKNTLNRQNSVQENYTNFLQLSDEEEFLKSFNLPRTRRNIRIVKNQIIEDQCFLDEFLLDADQYPSDHRENSLHKEISKAIQRKSHLRDGRGLWILEHICHLLDLPLCYFNMALVSHYLNKNISYSYLVEVVIRSPLELDFEKEEFLKERYKDYSLNVYIENFTPINLESEILSPKFLFGESDSKIISIKKYDKI